MVRSASISQRSILNQKIIINIFFFLLKIFNFLCFKILWKEKTLCEGTVLTKFTSIFYITGG